MVRLSNRICLNRFSDRICLNRLLKKNCANSSGLSNRIGLFACNVQKTVCTVSLITPDQGSKRRMDRRAVGGRFLPR